MKIEQLYTDSMLIRQGYRNCLVELIEAVENGRLKNKKDILLFLKACLNDVRMFMEHGKNCSFVVLTDNKGKPCRFELKHPDHSVLAEKKAQVAGILCDMLLGGKYAS